MSCRLIALAMLGCGSGGAPATPPVVAPVATSPTPVAPAKSAWTKCLKLTHPGRAIDLGGATLITGDYYKGADFGDGKDLGGGADFVAKFDDHGTPVWTHAFRGTSALSGVVVANDGTIYVVGDVNGDMDYGGIKITSKGGAVDAFLAALAPDGHLLWAKQFGNADTFGKFSSLRITEHGELEFASDLPAKFDYTSDKPQKLASEFPKENRIRFDRKGAFVASEPIAPLPGDDSDARRAATKVGDQTVTTWSEGEAPRKVHVEATGSKPWALQFDNSGQGEVGDTLLDAKGHTYISGGFQYDLDLGNGMKLETGYTSAFVAAVDGGTTRWAAVLGSPKSTSDQIAWVDSLVFDHHGNIVAGGIFKGELVSGATHVTANPSTDDQNHDGWAGFLASYSPDGKLRWVKDFPGRIHILELGGAHSIISYGHDNGLDPQCIAHDLELPD